MTTPNNVSQWTKEQVSQWLQRLSGKQQANDLWDKYISTFERNEIDGSVLLSLTLEELKSELNIGEFGIRKKIYSAIQNLLTSSPLPPTVEQVFNSSVPTHVGTETTSATTSPTTATAISNSSETIIEPEESALVSKKRTIDSVMGSEEVNPSAKRVKLENSNRSTDNNNNNTNDHSETMTFNVRPSVQSVVSSHHGASSSSSSSSSSRANDEEEQEKTPLFSCSQEERDRLFALSIEPRKCFICLDTFEVDFMQSLSECASDHPVNICIECMKDYFISSIENRQVLIKCPIPSCKKYATPDDLELLLEKKHIDLFESHALASVIDTNRDFCHCLTPDCDYSFLYEKGTDSPDFQCPKCQKRYCVNCKVGYHVGYTCEEYERWSIENGTADDTFDNFVQSKKIATM